MYNIAWLPLSLAAFLSSLTDTSTTLHHLVCYQTLLQNSSAKYMLWPMWPTGSPPQVSYTVAHRVCSSGWMCSSKVRIPRGHDCRRFRRQQTLSRIPSNASHQCIQETSDVGSSSHCVSYEWSVYVRAATCYVGCCQLLSCAVCLDIQDRPD